MLPAIGVKVNWGYSYNATAAADSYPWNNRKVFVDQSPLFSADKKLKPAFIAPWRCRY